MTKSTNKMNKSIHQIREGDLVTVWSNPKGMAAPLFIECAEVIYVPTQPGEPWGFLDLGGFGKPKLLHLENCPLIISKCD